MNLLLDFRGWCVLRLPTDPDPTDEPRGISGYTFAFAGEPDLDRVLHLQPPGGYLPRSHTPPLGVTVSAATKVDGDEQLPVAPLLGATVALLDDPMFQNRNWTLTLPGFEPIVPFHLQITAQSLTLRRDAPLNPADPDQPLWEVPAELLAAHGAHGMEYEPATVGQSTGIWDSMAVIVERLAALQAERDAAQQRGDDTAVANLDGRIAELQVAVTEPTDRRVMARYFVERFGFPMLGPATVDGDQVAVLGGTLDTTAPWPVYFWLGAWDPDLLCAFMSGVLEVPFTTTT
jgi:hypothetical protein